MAEPGAARTIAEVSLSKGRRLVVRVAQPDDVDGVRTLFEELSTTDRYRRFFSAYRPTTPFVERLVSLNDRGGACLVAEVVESSGTPQVVAEVDFSPLRSGDAELAMVVAEDWRGWLSPYLLDVLVGLAHERGIPNLQAEILITNDPMLALVRTRGGVVLDTEDWSTLRVTIGTTARRIPSWPSTHTRPRVLVERSCGHWKATEAARAAGFDVVCCPGPDARRPECPLLAGGACPLVDEADVVVLALREDDPEGEALLDAYRHHPDHPPLVIQIRDRAPGPEDPPEGAVELIRPSAEQLVAVMRELISTTDAPVPVATHIGGIWDDRP